MSVEDIATAAGLTRMTFYRHFSSRADLVAEMFKREVEVGMPRFTSIGTMDFRDRDSVVRWITGLFDVDRANRRLLRVFTQATADEADFTARAQELIGDLIRRLGAAIPAFDVDPDQVAGRRRWLEAWLLVYEILDQSNHAALGSGVATDPMVIDILADRFLRFVADVSHLNGGWNVGLGTCQQVHELR